MTNHEQDPAQLKVQLAAQEGRIEDGLTEAVDALRVIQRHKLYRADGHGTFAAYVEKRWGKKREWAYRQIWLAEAKELLPMGHKLNERQVRSLKRLRTVGDHSDQEIRRIWDRLLSTHGPTPTAAQVDTAVREELPELRVSTGHPGSGTLNATVEETRAYFNVPPDGTPPEPPKKQDVGFMFTEAEFELFRASVRVLRTAWEGMGIKANQDIVLHAVMTQASAVRGTPAPPSPKKKAPVPA